MPETKILWYKLSQKCIAIKFKHCQGSAINENKIINNYATVIHAFKILAPKTIQTGLVQKHL